MSALILAIDTTGESGSIALVSENGIVEEVTLASPDGFAHVLFGEIDALLKRAGIGVKDISAFASASGPGSFTGVRIGLTAAKGLAEAAGRPVVAVSNLQALAAFGNGPLHAVVIDARRGEIYGAVYDSALEIVRDEVVMKLDAWLESLRPGGIEFITNSQTIGEAIPAVFRDSPVQQISKPLAGAIGKIALDRFLRGLAQDPAEIDANYVRRSDAELLWKDLSGAKGPAAR